MRGNAGSDDLGERHSPESAEETARRFEAQIRRFSARTRELAAHSAHLRGHLAPLGVPESLLTELDARDAELAFAEAELREMSEALADALALASERAKSSAFFDEVPEASLVTDTAGTIQLANAAAAELLSVRKESMPGKRLIAFVARKDTRAFRDWLRGLHASQGPQRVETQLRPRGGTPFTATLLARRLFVAVDRGSTLRWSVSPTSRQSPRIDEPGYRGAHVERGVGGFEQDMRDCEGAARRNQAKHASLARHALARGIVVGEPSQAIREPNHLPAVPRLEAHVDDREIDPRAP